MQYSTHVLGIDAGNTKTIALVAQRDGQIVGAGRAGCGDIYGATSAPAAIAEIAGAARAALAAAGIGPTDLAACALSAAGADWPEDFEFLRDTVRAEGIHEDALVVNDAIGALWGGLPAGPGVVVACGTGTATGARSAEGRIWHTSFWQGPQGSGDLAHQALLAVWRAELGIEPATALTGVVTRFFGKSSAEEVLHSLTRREGRERPNIRPLGHRLLDAATAGDEVARRIVRAHGVALGDYALAAARKAGIAHAPFTLVLAGGTLRHHGPLLFDALVERVRTASPLVRAARARFEPALGAALIALDRAQVAIDEALIERLAASAPPPEFFSTHSQGDVEC
jgi:N-acetylglucosamine kinase-like BadF-type ATPase